jgi:hypothetical protein
MTTRDEFSASTRKALASRAGYLCSCPSCRVITIGPSREAPDDVAIVGVAAHICAAAEGGPRYEASMSPEQRSSIDNAIWLCAKHATLVDRDVVRFAPDVLRFWKVEHEAYVEAHIGEPHIREATPTLNGRPISSEAMQIATERSLLWETRLFGQLLRDEVARSADSIRNLHYGITLEEATVLEPVALFSAIGDAMKSAELIGPSITSLVDGPLREASPTGETGDPELIEYVAHAMKNALDRVATHPVAQVAQRADQPRVTPRRICGRHPDDQLLHVFAGGRATGASARRARGTSAGSSRASRGRRTRPAGDDLRSCP